jgi:hypothetical protein
MRGDGCRPRYETQAAPTHALCIQTMMSSRIQPQTPGGSGGTLQFTMSAPHRPRPGGNSLLSAIAQNVLEARWWSQTGSNRRPHACKARALPTELWPLIPKRRLAAGSPRTSLGASIFVMPARGVTQSVVGPGRLELPTSRLSGVCSNQLSYRPLKRFARQPGQILKGPARRRMRDRTVCLIGSGVSGKRNGDGDVPHLFRCLWKTNRKRERPGGLSLERR